MMAACSGTQAARLLVRGPLARLPCYSLRMRIDDPNATFGHASRCTFLERPGGYITLTLTTAISNCEIALQGAHVARFERKGEWPLLFLSEKSLFAPGKAIRGGVPLIFPWFGNHPDGPPKPAHGFARTAIWSVESVDVLRDDEAVCVLRLEPNDATRAAWPNDFTLRYRVAIGRSLELLLEVRNESKVPFTFESALHTYLEVGDVRKCSITGLENTEYIDKTDSFSRKRTGAGSVQLERETDSVFLNTAATCVVDDPGLGRRITVEKKGSMSTVVWNPWAEKAKSLPDLGDDEWPRMVCIETAIAADNAVTVGPGRSHLLEARIY